MRSLGLTKPEANLKKVDSAVLNPLLALTRQRRYGNSGARYCAHDTQRSVFVSRRSVRQSDVHCVYMHRICIQCESVNQYFTVIQSKLSVFHHYYAIAVFFLRVQWKWMGGDSHNIDQGRTLIFPEINSSINTQLSDLQPGHGNAAILRFNNCYKQTARDLARRFVVYTAASGAVVTSTLLLLNVTHVSSSATTIIITYTLCTWATKVIERNRATLDTYIVTTTRAVASHDHVPLFSAYVI
ncbi:hypothetical protein J6590_070313, partial [Homalodisca vitripennis]